MVRHEAPEARSHSVGARESDRLARLELGPDGVILDCNCAAAQSLSFAAGALRGVHVSRVFPQLTTEALLVDGRVNPRLAFRCRCGVPLEAVQAGGGRVAITVSPYALRNDGPLRILLVWPAGPAPLQLRRAAEPALRSIPTERLPPRSVRQRTRRRAQPEAMARARTGTDYR
jgi:hypothetical protein